MLFMFSFSPSNIETKIFKFFEIQSSDDYWIKTYLELFKNLVTFSISVLQSRSPERENKLFFFFFLKKKTNKAYMGLLRKQP